MVKESASNNLNITLSFVIVYTFSLFAGKSLLVKDLFFLSKKSFLFLDLNTFPVCHYKPL